MYGLINTSIKGYVIESYGYEPWAQILTGAEVDQGVFIEMRNHSDEDTVRLLEATAEVTGVPLERHLSLLGSYWVRRVATTRFSGLIDKYGSTLPALVSNLDAMHSEISNVFLNYQPPSFEIVQTSTFGFQITYRSQRRGLTSFVIGIIEELGVFYGQAVVISNVSQKPEMKGQESVIDLEMRPSSVEA